MSRPVVALAGRDLWSPILRARALSGHKSLWFLLFGVENVEKRFDLQYNFQILAEKIPKVSDIQAKVIAMMNIRKP